MKYEVINNFLVDTKNNNKVDLNKYTKEQAKNMLNSLVGCSYCENCKDCKDCAYCYDCVYCVYCFGCKDCFGCYECMNCNDKKEAFDIDTISDNLSYAVEKLQKITNEYTCETSENIDNYIENVSHYLEIVKARKDDWNECVPCSGCCNDYQLCECECGYCVDCRNCSTCKDCDTCKSSTNKKEMI